MPGEGELYPPIQYTLLWLIVAIAIILVLVAFYLIVHFWTRPRPAPPEGPPPPSGPVLTPERAAALKRECLSEIDDIQRRFAAGELDTRDTHLELSAAIRRFANDFSGIAAPVMTLDDLRAAGVRRELVTAVSRYYYPASFGSEEPGSIDGGVAAARAVVERWS